VPPDRLLNYQKLMRDAARGERTPLDRIAQRAVWKRLGKAGARRARAKHE
jgi:ribosome biogenesis GTPase